MKQEWRCNLRHEAVVQDLLISSCDGFYEVGETVFMLSGEHGLNISQHLFCFNLGEIHNTKKKDKNRKIKMLKNISNGLKQKDNSKTKTNVFFLTIAILVFISIFFVIKYIE